MVHDLPQAKHKNFHRKSNKSSAIKSQSIIDQPKPLTYNTNNLPWKIRTVFSLSNHPYSRGVSFKTPYKNKRKFIWFIAKIILYQMFSIRFSHILLIMCLGKNDKSWRWILMLENWAWNIKLIDIRCLKTHF